MPTSVEAPPRREPLVAACPSRGQAADYLLFVDRRAVGALEAKPEGHTLRGVEIQSGKYSTGDAGRMVARRPRGSTAAGRHE
ncbi:MAG: hypothetical protein HY744_18975 [Deltaproteobacteria bacterium]|nr:hypothetical protein [Deltaproteobacteria bacterium]